MRWLINYIRSCFCNHNWELLAYVNVYGDDNDNYPLGKKWTYRCKKCGYVKTHKNY